MLREDWATSGQRVANACEILLELHATLDTSLWPDGEGLAQLYVWLVAELSVPVVAAVAWSEKLAS